MKGTTWVVTGEASRLPVAVFIDKPELVQWLSTRRGTSMVRIYALWRGIDGSFAREEVLIGQLLREEKK